MVENEINIIVECIVYMVYRRKYKSSASKPVPQVNVISAVYLVIVESPSKCKKIESYLGSQYCCISSKGHIRNIKGLSSIDSAKDYETTYSIIEDKKDHVEWMKTVIAHFEKDNIYLATDDDREGEAIAWHICDVFGLPVETTPRITFHEITEPAIKRAIATPMRLDMNRVNAQKARQILDMTVGYKISPMLWKYIFRDKENSLSAGRCQTPALRLVYENDEMVRKQTIQTKHQIKGCFYPKKIEFQLNTTMETENEVRAFLEESKIHNHQLSIQEKRECVKSPPKPLNTSLLLQVAASGLHMSPKETMNLCQELYQEGHITYMRTESQKYSGVFLEDAKKYILRTYEESIGEGLENVESGNPHEAIRITHIEVETVKTENGRVNTLYRLIRKHTLESCMLPARYTHIPLVLSAPLGYHYRHTIEIPLFLGWKKVHKEPGENILLYIQGNSLESVKYNHIKSEITIHGRRSHYTEASLIQKLEEMGIGRPSTFATIVETVIERGYVERTDIVGEKIKGNEMRLTADGIETNETEKYVGNEKGKLVIRPIGVIVSDFLNANYGSLFEYEYTRRMEERLDEISTNEGEPWTTLCKECEAEIERCGSLKKTTYPIKDSEEYEVVYEKHGWGLRKNVGCGKYEYENIRKDIDIQRVKSGDYSLEELIERDMEFHMGERTALVKSGPYGKYLQMGDENISFKTLQLDETETCESNITEAFNRMDPESTKIIRKLTEEISIRNGKYGAYIHYKTSAMKKPRFYNLKTFKESYRFCNEETIMKWIKEKYNL
jgi:DNA topoisomerase-1